MHTVDGVEIRLRVNADSPRAYAKAVEAGAKGIGLFRSELLLSRSGVFPSESIQRSRYGALAEAAGRNRAVIRTFDLGSDHVLGEMGGRSGNPALGMRGVRLMLNLEGEFRRQLRALLRAAEGRSIDLLVPMVSDVDEIHAVKRLIREERAKLKTSGRRCGRLGIGAMIEVPSAVLMVGEILREVDFVSLGTNDLVQYLLAADRDSEAVADRYRTLHPAVLRAVKDVIDSAKAVGKGVIVCGEMAGTPEYSAVLVGLGATDLSMNPRSLPRVRDFLARVSAKKCRRIALEMLKGPTASDAEGLLHRIRLDSA